MRRGVGALALVGLMATACANAGERSSLEVPPASASRLAPLGDTWLSMNLHLYKTGALEAFNVDKSVVLDCRGRPSTGVADPAAACAALAANRTGCWSTGGRRASRSVRAATHSTYEGRFRMAVARGSPTATANGGPTSEPAGRRLGIRPFESRGAENSPSGALRTTRNLPIAMTWTRIPAPWGRSPPSSRSGSSSSRRTAACAGPTSLVRARRPPAARRAAGLARHRALARSRRRRVGLGAAGAGRGGRRRPSRRAAGRGVRWLHTRARFVDGRVVGWSRDLSADRAAATELDVLRTVAEKHSRTDPLTRRRDPPVPERAAGGRARPLRSRRRDARPRAGRAAGPAHHQRAAGPRRRATPCCCEIATRLAGVVRRYDTVGRWDGARFAVLAPSVTSQAALNAVAGKLQASIEREPVVVEGVAVPVFATVGCARAVGRGHRAEAVVDAAEARPARRPRGRARRRAPGARQPLGGRRCRRRGRPPGPRPGPVGRRPRGRARVARRRRRRPLRPPGPRPRAGAARGADLPPGGLAARRRHGRRARRHPGRERRADRQPTGTCCAPRRGGRGHRAPRRRPGARGDAGAPPPRALGRQRLPRRAGRRGHPARGPHRGRRPTPGSR